MPCAFSVLLLYLSFPPVGAWPLAWVAFVPLLFLLDTIATRRGAFGWAFLAGTLFFLSVANWVTGFVSSFFHPLIGAGLLTVLAAYLGFYFALGCVWWYFVKGRSPVVASLLFAAGWVVFEYIRSLTWFGWALLGQTQVHLPILIQIADITGQAGVSFVVALGNAAIFYLLRDLWQHRMVRRETMVVVALAVGSIAVVVIYGGLALTRAPVGPQVRIAVVQANVPLADTWDQRQNGSIVDRHIGLSQRVLEPKPDLIIWPETAFPSYIWEETGLLEKVRAFVGHSQTPLLFGAVTRLDGLFYNSALWLNADGKDGGRYNKRHLLMFGEYIPLRRQIPLIDQLAPVEDFSPGNQVALFSLKKGVHAAALICIEDTVPDLARDAVRNGADILLNLTNDAWFGYSVGARMHAEVATFRAVENRIPLIRSTNTGLSYSIDAWGRVEDRVQDVLGKELMVPGVGSFLVRPGPGGTFYTKHGDIFTLLSFLGILSWLISLWFLKRGTCHGRP